MISRNAELRVTIRTLALLGRFPALDGADAAPTVQVLATLGELERVWAGQLNEMKKIEGGLPELNRKLREAGVGEVSQSYRLEVEPAQGAERSEE